eukprot:612264-Pelagomonas_calceolata.AAC.1
MPEPDAVAVPSEEEMQGLVAEQIGKMNGRVSPGIDCVAAPFYQICYCGAPAGQWPGHWAGGCAGAIHCLAFQAVI